MAFDEQKFIKESLREIFDTARLCTEAGLGFSWIFKFRDKSLCIRYKSLNEIDHYQLMIEADGFPIGMFASLSEVPGLGESTSGVWTGEFTYDWDSFFSSTSPTLVAWEILRMAPNKLKKGGSNSFVVNVDGTYLPSHSHEEVRMFAIDHRDNHSFSATGDQVITALFVGGFGYELVKDSVVSLEAGLEGFLVRDFDKNSAVQIPYVDVVNFEMEGGLVQRGGGFAGGGFGIVGFAAGAAASMALNKITSKSEIQTMLRLVTRNGEVVLYTNQATPDQIEIAFSEARMRIRNAANTPAAVNNQSNSISVADELTKLSALRDSGVLTEEEFQRAKSRLLP
jgi:hypothetical protein